MHFPGSKSKYCSFSVFTRTPDKPIQSLVMLSAYKPTLTWSWTHCCVIRGQGIKPHVISRINSLAPGRDGSNFKTKTIIFELIIHNNTLDTHWEIAPKWMLQNLTDGKSTLFQAMAWCCQATSHYLSQCWPRFMSPYSVTRPQRVKLCSKINVVTGLTSRHKNIMKMHMKTLLL